MKYEEDTSNSGWLFTDPRPNDLAKALADLGGVLDTNQNQDVCDPDPSGDSGGDTISSTTGVSSRGLNALEGPESTRGGGGSSEADPGNADFPDGARMF